MAHAAIDKRCICMIAALAECDHRTVISFLAGKAKSTRARARIAEAMSRLGLTDHIPGAVGLEPAE